MTDCIFPASGELAPVTDYYELLQNQKGSRLLLDDAHGSGVLGERGRGALEYFEIKDPMVAASLTLRKAFGSFGEIIPCTSVLKTAIERNSEVTRGASVPPLGILAASAKTFQLLNQDRSILTRLKANICKVGLGLSDAGWDIHPTSPSPLLRIESDVPGYLSSLANHLFHDEKICLNLCDQGYPGIPPGGCLLFSIFANHSDSQLDHLFRYRGQIVEGQE